MYSPPQICHNGQCQKPWATPRRIINFISNAWETANSSLSLMIGSGGWGNRAEMCAWRSVKYSVAINGSRSARSARLQRCRLLVSAAGKAYRRHCIILVRAVSNFISLLLSHLLLFLFIYIFFSFSCILSSNCSEILAALQSALDKWLLTFSSH